MPPVDIGAELPHLGAYSFRLGANGVRVRQEGGHGNLGTVADIVQDREGLFDCRRHGTFLPMLNLTQLTNIELSATSVDFKKPPFGAL